LSNAHIIPQGQTLKVKQVMKGSINLNLQNKCQNLNEFFQGLKNYKKQRKNKKDNLTLVKS